MSSNLPAITPAQLSANEQSLFNNDDSPSNTSATSPHPSSNASTSSSNEEPRRFLPLSERVPKTSTILEVVVSKQKVKDMLLYSTYFTDEKNWPVLFNVEFWETVSSSNVNAILECLDMGTSKDIKWINKRYRQMYHDILDYIGRYDITRREIHPYRS